MTTGERIKARRRELGLTAEDLSRAIGVDRSTLYRYENGDIEKVPMTVMNLLSQALYTTPDFFADPGIGTQKQASYGEHEFSPVEKKRIPMLGEIACGKPIFANEEHETFVDATAGIEADFCLRAKGDSMINARIFDGDIVFVRKQSAVKNGEIAVVVIDDEATLKRLYYYGEKQKLVLQAENPRYEPLVYTGEELDHVRVLGKAVACLNRLN